MDDHDKHTHDVATCTRAWQTLRLAHDRVAQRLATELDRACALALNEFDVLFYLRAHDDAVVRVSALLDAVPLSQPALSRLVARLEARGLLSRSGAESDRRAFVVCLTESGTVLIDRATDVYARAVHDTLTSRLSESERATLLRTLSQIGQ
jgi:DNA-binding MarR family transcriptional regulator